MESERATIAVEDIYDALNRIVGELARLNETMKQIRNQNVSPKGKN